MGWGFWNGFGTPLLGRFLLTSADVSIRTGLLLTSDFFYDLKGEETVIQLL